MYVNSEDSRPHPNGAGDSPALIVEGLGKRYRKGGGFVVRGLSFVCRAGEIVALVGKNGAGKSTTLRCIAGILPFEEGGVSVCGRRVCGDAVETKRLTGYVPDDHAVIPYLTGREYLKFLADVRGVSSAAQSTATNDLAARLGVSHALDIPLFQCSHGTAQKICMLGSLVGGPRLWLLDEPVTGLDPRSQEETVGIMQDFAAGGGTVLFSSHDTAMVKRACARVLEVRDGGVHEVAIEDIESENT